MSTTPTFVETDIALQAGHFRIRVYADAPGKETVVLSTPDLDTSNPVLTRIHSECLTGDVFHSQHCDCGEQLAVSLNILAKQSGVLIYLRQEGRGIGLFEKIKSYELQRQGHDTYEANIMLGHAADERTYEKAKQALVDLDITHIRLLTNNPLKVKEMTKLGLDVTERVPLIIQANEQNKAYMQTKKERFGHYL